MKLFAAALKNFNSRIGFGKSLVPCKENCSFSALHSRWLPRNMPFSSTLSNSPSGEIASSPSANPLFPSRSSLSDSQGKKIGEIGRAILSGIKQSPKKVNLVATLIRGMRVEDAIAQLSVSQKRAAVAMKNIVHSAAANAVNNHGLNKDKLVISEAFVGKKKYLRRISIHGRGKSGVMHRPRSMLTVIVKEMTEKQEKQYQFLKAKPWLKRGPNPLLPHKLIVVRKPEESTANTEP